MPEKTIAIENVVNILISQAPRGMGGQVAIIVDWLFCGYYQKTTVKRPHRSTISRNLRGITRFNPGLLCYCRADPDGMDQSIRHMLERYPGVAGIYTINNQVGCLVRDSKLPDSAKQMLQAEYHPDSTDVCVISRYVAHVMHYAVNGV